VSGSPATPGRTMPRESRRVKAVRYLGEGRVILTAVGPGKVRASVRGDSGTIYRAGFQLGAWTCDCQVRTDMCSHLIALRLVTAPEVPR